MNLDYNLFQLINGLADKAAFLNQTIRFLAQDAEYIFYLGVIIYWFTRIRMNRHMVGQALVSAAIGLGISGIISHFFYRSRPFVDHTVIQLISHPANASFPSDHSTAAFAIAVSFWLFRKREGRAWLVLAALIAFSRVWAGVHYPTDIFAGFLLGSASAFGVHALFLRLKVAQLVRDSIIQIYEKMESKVWPRSQPGKSGSRKQNF